MSQSCYTMRKRRSIAAASRTALILSASRRFERQRTIWAARGCDGEILRFAQDDVSIAQDDVSIAQDDVSIAQDGVSIAQDGVSIAQDGVSIAQDGVSRRRHV